MQPNQSNRIKSIEKIVSAFAGIEKMPKALIRYGSYLSIAIWAIGTILVLLNNTILSYDSYLDMLSKEIVKVSFEIAAEAIIGGLILDFVFKRQ